jgi:transcriptional regulator with XRE-family HTH domain
LELRRDGDEKEKDIAPQRAGAATDEGDARATCPRDAEHITQKSLEEISGVSQSAISSLKNGITLDNVTCATVARLAIALNADMGWLVLGKGDTIPKLVADAKAGGVAVLDEARSAPLVPHPRKPSKARKRFPRQA